MSNANNNDDIITKPKSNHANINTNHKSNNNQEEKGHRYGNFHNYYTFNPTSNRLSILNQLKMFDYLRESLSSQNTTIMDQEQRQIKRQKRITSSNDTTSCTTATNQCHDSRRQIITYCDLGCNEGDLTISIAEHLLNMMNETITKNNNTSTNDTSSICCNQSIHNNTIVKCLGMDIDPTLIQRANKKYRKGNTNTAAAADDDDDFIHSTFQTCNIAANIKNFEYKCQSFLQDIKYNNSCEINSKEKDSMTKSKLDQKQRFDLISIFSTSMWIHIHHGDEGLKSLLQSICSQCRYVLIEPQPSKCYRNVNSRLRKMNLQEIDVSVERLKMRCDIENEIEKVIINCGFERVDCLRGTHECDCIDKDSSDDRTKWNRTLRLYKWTQNSSTM